MKPHVADAPGLVWREIKGKWHAYWRARKDIIKRGFTPKNKLLWSGDQPTDLEAADISDQCRRLQDEMLFFSRNNETASPKIAVVFNGTLKSLIACYQTDPDSPYHEKRYAGRRKTDYNLSRMVEDHGETVLSEINARLVKTWHRDWVGPENHIAMAHVFIGHLRTLVRFGATFLEDAECQRLSGMLSSMQFKMPKAREEELTADMVIAHRAKAHDRGWNFMALGQAIQFDLTMRQKDVIGEWVPIGEPGLSDTFYKDTKWITGIRWEEIDEHLVLRHVTSKRNKPIEVNLRLAPMVMEELEDLCGVPAAQLTRNHLPAAGPIILCEITGIPYLATEFRRKWRKVADDAGIPKKIWNMDSRAGAISEATDAGAELEHVRHAATHSNISMTQRYSRGASKKVAKVMEIRLKHRNKKETE